MKQLLMMILGWLLVLPVMAQQPVPGGDSSGAKRDSVRSEQRVHPKPATVSGFRVQVYSGNNRAQAIQIRTEVLEKFPEYAAYLIYKQPTFRVRVGDFRSRAAAQELLRELKPLYPVSFIVPDEVLENPVLAPKEPVEPLDDEADRRDP